VTALRIERQNVHARRRRLAALILLAAAPSLGLAVSPRASRADEPPAAPAPAPEAPGKRMFDPRFREGAAADVLVAGEAPLLRGTLDAFVDLLEAWHDITLPTAEEQALRDAIETWWPKMTDEDRLWFRRQAMARDRMRPAPTGGEPFDAATAKNYLDGFGRDVDARVAAAPGRPWAAVIVRARDRKFTPFSPAPAPAVSVAAVEALEEMVTFLVSVARNDAEAPTEGQRIAVRPSIHKMMDASGAVVRGQYAKAPRLWALVRAKWDRADDAGRLRLRWAALKLFRRIAKQPVPTGTVVLDLPGYATLASEVAAAMNPADAYTSAFANLGEVVTAVVDGLGVDAKDLESAFNADRLTMR
jgi:hypothetical protein